jgi:3-hydroxybutyryl-CoA dehydrogenase
VIEAPIRTVAVIGAGTMGAGIAQVFAQAGFEVRLHDISESALDRARAVVSRSLDRFVEKGTLDRGQRDAALGRIRASTSSDRLADAGLVIEAIVEDERAKLALFTGLDDLAAADALLASNTSSISITRLAAVTRRPARVFGMHFMNPVPLMTLVELVRGQWTSDQTMTAARALCSRLGKIAVEAADYPGFIANRILMPMINEAVFALMEGVGTAEAIDTVMQEGMKHPMGPLRLADLIGLDVCLAVLEVLHAGLGDPKYRPCPLLRRLVDAGQLGRKSGRGFYEYA